jgi:hypothetical protein
MANTTSITSISINSAYPAIPMSTSVAAVDTTSVAGYNTPNLGNVSSILLPLLLSPTLTDAYAQQATVPSQNPIEIPAQNNTQVAQSSTNSQTLYSINSKSLNFNSVRVSADDPDFQDMYKVPIPGGTNIYEIPNTLQKFNGTPVFFEMVDSTGALQGVQFQGNYIETLKLTPNPDTLTVTSGKKITRSMAMTGWVEEHWGDDIDTISLSGSTFSFFTLDNGLTNEFRDQTAAYAFIKELIYYYQVNGCIYQGSDDYEASDSLSVKEFMYNNPEFVNNHPRKGMMKERLYIKMYYDYLTLFGRFETFDIIEDASVPFRLKYNIIFKAERTLYNLDTI